MLVIDDDPPELSRLDRRRPGLDGFAFVAERPRPAQWRDLPVVVLTANDLTPAERQGLTGCIERVWRTGPSSRDQVLAEVRAQFARRRYAAACSGA